MVSPTQLFNAARRFLAFELLPVAWFLLLSLISFREVLREEGTIGFLQDWMIPPYGDQMARMATSIFDAWVSRNLGAAATYRSGDLVLVLYGLLSLLGANGGSVSKLLPAALLVIAGYSCHLLCRRLGMPRTSAYVVGTFYLCSPVVFNRVAAGQIGYLIAYAVAPAALYFFMRLLTENRARDFAICCLLCALVSVQIQYAIMLSIVMLALAFTLSKMKGILRLTLVWTVVACVHAYWIVPMMLNTSLLRVSLASASQRWITYQSAPIIDSLRMVGYLTRYFEISLSTSGLFLTWQVFSSCLLGLALLPVLFRGRSKFVLMWTGLFIAFGLLASGAEGPFGFAVLYLYVANALSIQSLFREVYHFSGVTALSFSVLLGYAGQLAGELFSSASLGRLRPKVARASVFATFFLLILAGNPLLLTGNYGGYLQTFDFGSSYQSLYNRFKDDPSDYRVLYLPMVGPIRFRNLVYSGWDPMITYSPKDSLGNAPDLPFIAYLGRSLYDEENTHLSALMGVASVRYVVLRSDFSSTLPDFVFPTPRFREFWSSDNLAETVNRQEGLQLDSSAGTYLVFRNLFEKPRIWGSYNGILTSGGFKSIEDILFSTPGAIAVSADQNVALQSFREIALSGAFRTSNERNDALWAAASALLRPGNIQFANEDARSEWTRSSNWWWYDSRIAGLIEDGSFTLAAASTTIPFEAPAGSYTILARVATDRKDLVFTIDGTIQLAATGHDGDPEWVDAGQVSLAGGHHLLRISAKHEGFHLVGDIALVDFEKNLKLPRFEDVPQDTSEPTIVYERIAQNRFRVHVRSTRSVFLVLSEKYNSNWKAVLDGEEVRTQMTCNGFSNCWWLNRTGDYWVNIVLETQSYLLTGLVISSVSVILLAVCVVAEDAVGRWSKTRHPSFRRDATASTRNQQQSLEIQPAEAHGLS